MPKLHELLAAETSVAAAYNGIAGETLKVFDKPEHFIKTVKTIGHFAEDDKKLDTTETKDVVTSVDDRMRYSFGRAFVNYFNLLAQKDRTNQEARANVVINGQIILADMPATALLTLETKLGETRRALMAIPTLQPGPVWVKDEATGMWRTETAAVTFRTKKTLRAFRLAEATKEHPEQAQALNEDVPIAKIEQMTWSSMWTSQQKHDVLARLDAMLVAIKKARQRANRTEVVPMRAGEAIAKFILNGPAADQLTGDDSGSAAA